MEAERQEHLEAVVYSETPEQREEHLSIVRWLKQFFDVMGREQELRAERQAREAHETFDYSTGSDWMRPDSGTVVDVEG